MFRTILFWILIIGIVLYVANNPGVGTSLGNDVHGLITALSGFFHRAAQ